MDRPGPVVIAAEDLGIAAGDPGIAAGDPGIAAEAAAHGATGHRSEKTQALKSASSRFAASPRS